MSTTAYILGAMLLPPAATSTERPRGGQMGPRVIDTQKDKVRGSRGVGGELAVRCLQCFWAVGRRQACGLKGSADQAAYIVFRQGHAGWGVSLSGCLLASGFACSPVEPGSMASHRSQALNLPRLLAWLTLGQCCSPAAAALLLHPVQMLSCPLLCAKTLAGSSPHEFLTRCLFGPLLQQSASERFSSTLH